MRLFSLLLLGSLAAAADTAQPLVAVLEVRNKLPPDVKDADAGYFSDVVRSNALDTLPNARLMTRENMLVLLAADGKELSACEGECEVDTGRKLGADYVISGELLRVGTSLKLDLKLHATADGRLLGGSVANGKSVDALDEAVPASVTRLLASLKAQSPAPAPAAPQPRAPAQPAKYEHIVVRDDRIVHKGVFFKGGSRNIAPEAMPMLREVASAIVASGRPAVISCIAKKAELAKRRGERQRAMALRVGLVNLGVPASKIRLEVRNPGPQHAGGDETRRCDLLLR